MERFPVRKSIGWKLLSQAVEKNGGYFRTVFSGWLATLPDMN